MLLISYRLSMELWRRFFDAHFAADPLLQTRYFWGIVCIVISALGFGGIYRSHLVAGLLMATGFFGVLSRQILVVKSLRKAVRHPYYEQVLTVGINRQELVVRCGYTGYHQPWSNFVGFREVRPGFMFYHDRQSFFFIPRQALPREQEIELKGILQESGLARL